MYTKNIGNIQRCMEYFKATAGVCTPKMQATYSRKVLRYGVYIQKHR